MSDFSITSAPRMTEAVGPPVRERIVARDGTKTARREDRSRVRQFLGTSRDDAPSIRAAVKALAALARIIEDASGGHYKVNVYNRKTGVVASPLDVQVALMDAEVID